MNKNQTEKEAVALAALMEANLNAVHAALAAKPAKSLVERCNVEFDDQAHDEDWRNQCARDLNVILDRVAQTVEAGSSQDSVFAEAALRIVERVAEFEAITERDEALDEQEARELAPPSDVACERCRDAGCSSCEEQD